MDGRTRGSSRASRRGLLSRPPSVVAPKVCRNSLSATSGERRSTSTEQPPVLEAKQLAALVNSVNQISKEVCPPSAFTIKRSVKVDGVQVEVNISPTCLAAEMARQNPDYLAPR